MSLELRKAVGAECPVEGNVLEEWIRLSIPALTDTEAFIADLAGKLAKKSSQHKFLVLVTKVDAAADQQVCVQATIGAVWTDNKDGYRCFEVRGEAIHLVTVYWLHASS